MYNSRKPTPGRPPKISVTDQLGTLEPKGQQAGARQEPSVEELCEVRRLGAHGIVRGQVRRGDLVARAAKVGKHGDVAALRGLVEPGLEGGGRVHGAGLGHVDAAALGQPDRRKVAQRLQQQVAHLAGRREERRQRRRRGVVVPAVGAPGDARGRGGGGEEEEGGGRELCVGGKRVLLLVLCWRQRGGFTGLGGDANAARTCMVVVGVGCLKVM